ncbi:MAG TPA: UDP-N-acetylmuramoyl-L-alanyl-D-glutamate--2,6-diaminopimelate ligase [Solibacterales bacterium]|jgi:UDP-N-acetylmuramoyl-L-alanyl-D-glutamate--2,6-diaminopimelate ligase|nr:UDP-N-acetylmuramoyl-L-alanyl-D-glutamate--2,6-diaminopimelate ligase [Bryobacterales bacterium]
MNLAELLAGAPLTQPLGPELASLAVTGCAYDSRKVEPGEVFFAFPGARADGREFAREAVEKGAAAVVSESPAPEGFEAPWIQVTHGRQALALAARRLFGRPDEHIGLTGITGTNGKTTTSYLVDSILRAAGKTTALIGTIEYRLAGEVLPAPNTTPESLELLRLLDQLRAAGGSHATMEVSSHALALGRVYGLQFHTAVFTNLTRDHLDFHLTMESYFGAKRHLFEGAGSPPPRFAVINADDPYGRRLKLAKETEVFWYGLGPESIYKAKHIQSTFDGLRFDVRVGKKLKMPIESPLIGRINVYNILAACCVGLSYGIATETIAEGVRNCAGVPGRYERVDEGQPFAVVVDYSHTDDALQNVIQVSRALSPRRIITVFGCGGDRDRTKRPLMGQAAAEGSDMVILTSDNPRSEDPLQIMNDVMVGLRRFDVPLVVEPDRAAAIRRAIEAAAPGDIVILAGKGHETYQILKDRTIHFDDREMAREVLRGFGYRK